MPKLKRSFFLQPTIKAARELLGKVLVHEYKGKILKGVITETEAYIGIKDKACHSYNGRKTKRTQIMFEKGGKAYPYFVYGVHWLFNITTGKKDEPEAVLIRGLDIADGPAKLTKILKLDGSLYGYDLCKYDSKIYVEDISVQNKRSGIIILPRVGINYAGPYWSKKKLRFLLKTKEI